MYMLCLRSLYLIAFIEAEPASESTLITAHDCGRRAARATDSGAFCAEHVTLTGAYTLKNKFNKWRCIYWYCFMI